VIGYTRSAGQADKEEHPGAAPPGAAAERRMGATMRSLFRKLHDRVYTDDSFIARWRRARMFAMLQYVNPPPKARVIDLGGDDYIWGLFDHDFHITLVNLPGTKISTGDPERFTYVQADACSLSDAFEDNAFDLVFSNSVIEHVGDEMQQEKFAAQIQRLAPAYWVQTPSNRWPLEPHIGVFFYWQRSEAARKRLHDKWRKKRPRWAENTVLRMRVLSRERMQTLFPDGRVFVERKFGLEKSYVLYRPYPRM